MSKKRGPSSPILNAKKRFKSQNVQSHIDHFFSSPSKAKSQDLSRSLDLSGLRQPNFVQGSSRTAVTSTEAPQIIDVDAIDAADHSEGIELTYPPVKGVASIRLQSVVGTAVNFSPLDVNPRDYDPQSQPSASKAPYALLTHAFMALSQTKSRITILHILTNALRTIISQYPSSLLQSIYLLSNSLKPQFVAVELGLGSSIISRAIEQISGLSAAALRKLYNATGDPGDVAFAAKSNLRTLIPHPPLTIPFVYDSLIKIARCRGQGATKEKQKIVEKLLLAASGEEVRYITRTLCQNLRVGAVRTSILTALARAIALTPPPGVSDQIVNNKREFHRKQSVMPKQSSPIKGKTRTTEGDQRDELVAILHQAENLMKQVYARHPNFDDIVPALLEKGLESLSERVPLTVGTPLLPMLGSPTRSLHEIYRRLDCNPFTAEFKYDGQRAQIHASCMKEDYKVKVFSRHLEDMTSKYPDIIALVKKILKDFEITSFIMDAEVVAIDPDSKVLKSFQELSNRARKDVNLKDVRISVCVFAFDLMFLDDEPLLNRNFRDRRSLLRSKFAPIHPPHDSLMAHFDFVRSCESEAGKQSIEEFMTQAIESRCEGLMIKLLDKASVKEGTATKKGNLKLLPSTYEPDLRSSAWLKLKKDYMEGIGDSLDLIPVGAWHGNGRKAQWWSPVLLALWDPERGQPIAVCKCMSGFSDAFYKSMRQLYALESEECSKQPLWNCDLGGYKPDVYFRPQEVWEIRGADVTESPVSTAARGLVSSSRGLSIRFPRFIKAREDKNIEQGSTPSFLADMFRSQQGKGNVEHEDEDELIDVDFESTQGSDQSEEDF